MKSKVMKPLLLSAAAILLVVVTVFATMAYLTSTSAVSNVFTVGNVKINMTETKVNSDGEPLDANGNVVTDLSLAERVDANSYHLLPGKSYLKDPTVTIGEKCDSSYLFVRVRNDLKSIEKKGDAEHPTIVQQLEANGWFEIERADSNVDAVFVYAGKDGIGNQTEQSNGEGGTITAPMAELVGGSNTTKNIPVFEEFTITEKIVITNEDGNQTDASLDAFGGARVAIVAYAIQADIAGYETGTYEAYKSAWEYIKAELPFVV